MPSGNSFDVRWVAAPHLKIPLAELKQPPSRWEWGNDAGATLYSLLFTAHDWGIRPSALGICAPEEDLGLMQAFTQTRARMRAWEEGRARGQG